MFVDCKCPLIRSLTLLSDQKSVTRGKESFVVLTTGERLEKVVFRLLNTFMTTAPRACVAIRTLIDIMPSKRFRRLLRDAVDAELLSLVASKPS